MTISRDLTKDIWESKLESFGAADAVSGASVEKPKAKIGKLKAVLSS